MLTAKLRLLLAAALPLVALAAGCAVGAETGGNAAAASFSVATVSRGEITRSLRIAGTTLATQSFTLRIPQIPGQNEQFVLVSIVPNGTTVKQGEVLAQFDDTAEAQNALDAKAKFDDLTHQVADQQAQNLANAAQRDSDMQQAQSDLGKALLEMRKTPILSQIDAETDQLNVEDARDHIADLTKENADKARADTATLRILELQRDQQQVEWERAQTAVAALTLKAPLSGMVGLLPVFRADSEGPAQPGDQLYSGQTLLEIFSRGDMEVTGQINQADGATLTPGLRGTLRVDAYPNLRLPVHFLSMSPMAVAGGFGVPIRTFSALFHVDSADPRLFPALSASVDLRVSSPQPELLIPRRALHFMGEQPYVIARHGGAAWRRANVELGNFNSQQVQILAGLTAGDEVQVAAADDAEGQ